MPNAVPPGKRWVVTGQTHRVGIDPAGNAGPGWNITFMSAAGDTGETFIPDARYNAESVRVAIDAIVTEMEHVGGLTG